MTENPFSPAIKMLHLKTGVSRTRLKSPVFFRNNIPKSTKRNYQVSNGTDVTVKNCLHLENMVIIIKLSLLVLCPFFKHNDSLCMYIWVSVLAHACIHIFTTGNSTGYQWFLNCLCKQRSLSGVM